MAVHVRYISLYISSPSSAKQNVQDQILCGLENVHLIFILNLPQCFGFTFAIASTVINKVDDFGVSRDL